MWGQGAQTGGVGTGVGQAGWGAEKTTREAFFRKWSTVFESLELSDRECAVSRRGSLHGESPSRSGGAAVTGTKLLSRAFHQKPATPHQPFSSGE